MNRIFKNLSLALTLCVVSVFFSGSAIAVDESSITEKVEQKKTEMRAEVCEKFSSAKFTSGVSAKADNATIEVTNNTSKLSEKRAEWDVKRTEVRTAADSKRKEHYDSLRSRAVSDEQKAAVEEFVSSVEAAVSTRRASQDAARESYRSSVNALIATQQADIKQAIDTFKADSLAALAKAKSSCENGVSRDQVMEILKVDLSKARSDFKASVSGREKLGDSIKPLVEIRKQSLETAKTVFEQSMKEAKDALASVLKGTD